MSDDRQAFVLKLDDELLKGSVFVSDWSSFLVGQADESFCAGADLATILLAHAAIESHLRFEREPQNSRANSAQLITESGLPAELQEELHQIRKFRNSWVHIEDPHSNAGDGIDEEIETMAWRAVVALRKTIYAWQGT